MRTPILLALTFVAVLAFLTGNACPADRHGGEGTHKSTKTKAAPKQKTTPKQKAGPKQKDSFAEKKKASRTHSFDRKKKPSKGPDKGKADLTGPGTHKPPALERLGTPGVRVPTSGLTAPGAHGGPTRALAPGAVQALHGSRHPLQPTDPARLHGVARDARSQFAPNHRHAFTPRWWQNRHMTNPAHVGWYPRWWRHHNPYHWWRHANWNALTGWLPGVAWAAPVVYDYGKQLYYGDDGVYLNGTRQYSPGQYYQLVRNLAQTQPAGVSENSEWLPMGVFALQRPESASPHAMVQLAMSKEGAIAGTSYDIAGDKTLPIHGSVDKQTQRVAWMTSGDEKDRMVVETWAQNLTRNESDALVHFGPNKPEKWFMVRLEAPAAAARIRLWNPPPLM
ncbi:MAG: hypothetical protein AB1646_12400 [Thermodesulfobacteriota bacterium]